MNSTLGRDVWWLLGRSKPNSDRPSPRRKRRWRLARVRPGVGLATWGSSSRALTMSGNWGRALQSLSSDRSAGGTRADGVGDGWLTNRPGSVCTWRDGFEVTVTASGVAARDARSQAAGPRGLFRWKRPARTGITPLFGVEYSSGARAANVNDLRPEVQTEDVLILRTSAHGRSSGSFLGSAGVSRSITCSYWLSPLPPAGPVRFVCAWPECGIPEHRVEIDASELANRLGE